VKWFADHEHGVADIDDGVVADKDACEITGNESGNIVADTGMSDIDDGDVSDKDGGDIARIHVGDAADEDGENANHGQDDYSVGGLSGSALAQVYLYSLTRLASKGY
jgi:hypothetical protein